jgi:hypothetical protein
MLKRCIRLFWEMRRQKGSAPIRYKKPRTAKSTEIAESCTNAVFA